jgi:hypothetical protein
MFVQLVANVCQHVDETNAASPEMCTERKVLNTDQNPEFDWGSCMFSAQMVLAQWKETGEWSGPRFRIARWKCIPDRGYILHGAA